MPFADYPGIPPRIIQETAFQLASWGMILAGFVSERKVRFSTGDWWLVAFSAWAVFLYCFWGFKTGNTFVVNVFTGVALYFSALGCLDREECKRIFKWVLFVCVVNLLVMVSQLYGFDPLYPGNRDLTGTFGIKMSMAIYFACAVPLLAYFVPWAPVLFMWPMYVSAATSPVLGALFSWCFYTWKKARLLFWAILVFALAGFAYFEWKVEGRMDHNQTRWTMWYQTLTKSLTHPIVGWGPDSYRFLTSEKPFFFVRVNQGRPSAKNMVINVANMPKGAVVPIQEADQFVHTDEFKPEIVNLWDNPHSSYLALLFETGLVGLALFIGFFFACVKRFLRAFKTPEVMALAAALLAFLICGLTHFPERLARNVYIIPILLALFMIHTENETA